MEQYYYDIIKNTVKNTSTKYYIEFISKSSIENNEDGGDSVYNEPCDILNSIVSVKLKEKLYLVMDNFYSFDGKKSEFKSLIHDEENFEKIPGIFYIFD